MAEMEGMKSVRNAFLKVRHKYGGGKVGVVVGYKGVNYALYVHESAIAERGRRLLIKLGIGGKNPKAQWKFLEQPARELRDVFVDIIKIALKAGLPVIEALYLAGNRLQRESQELVPVVTGNLKGSAFTEKENVG